MKDLLVSTIISVFILTIVLVLIIFALNRSRDFNTSKRDTFYAGTRNPNQSCNFTKDLSGTYKVQSFVNLQELYNVENKANNITVKKSNNNNCEYDVYNIDNNMYKYTSISIDSNNVISYGALNSLIGTLMPLNKNITWNDLHGNRVLKWTPFVFPKNHTKENETPSLSPTIPTNPTQSLNGDLATTPLNPTIPARSLNGDLATTPLNPIIPTQSLNGDLATTPLNPIIPTQSLNGDLANSPLSPTIPARSLNGDLANSPSSSLNGDLATEYVYQRGNWTRFMNMRSMVQVRRKAISIRINYDSTSDPYRILTNVYNESITLGQVASYPTFEMNINLEPGWGSANKNKTFSSYDNKDISISVVEDSVNNSYLLKIDVNIKPYIDFSSNPCSNFPTNKCKLGIPILSEILGNITIQDSGLYEAIMNYNTNNELEVSLMVGYANYRTIDDYFYIPK